MKYFFPFLIILILLSSCSDNYKNIDLKVLQFNIWQEGTQVNGAYEAIINEIIHTDADLIALSEVRNYNNSPLDKRLVHSLKEKGFQYYSLASEDTGILSRYPIKKQTAFFPVVNDHGSITKAIIDVKGVDIVLYSAHLDYLNCALYLPRGYHGSTWKKLDEPITDKIEVEKVNLASQREEAISAFIIDAKKEIKENRIIILAGDFNEPSHLDWIEETKNLFDHNGLVMPWNYSLMLHNAGFVDSYRKIFPNPISHPGFTYPADNTLVPINRLAWSPDADDRDRIDAIYFHPDSRIELVSSSILGPIGSIVKNKRVEENTEDVFIKPLDIWPTDHKAILSVFKLKTPLK